MFSSLDRIDLVTQDPRTGKKAFHQTDHRSTAEVQQEAELSILFALTRVMNARQMGEREGGVRVLYVCFEKPPDFLQRAVVAAGGRLMVNDQDLIYEGVLGTPEELADEAFRKLARRVLRERDLPLDESSLSALEQDFLGSPGPEDDEIGYWTRVVELAAVTAELLRTQVGGKWIEAPNMATVPFVFHLAPGGESSPRINALGRAERFLQNGERDSLLHLLRMAEDHANRKEQPKRVLFTLKAPGWVGQDKTVCRPVLEGEKTAAEVPLLAYGEDMPNSFAIFVKDGTREREMDVMHAQALETLKGVEVQVQEIEESEGKLFVVSGSYFAAEKLLDVDFMRGMHERLQSPLLVAGVPRKGLLFIGDVREPQLMNGLMAILAAEHAKNASEPISPTPLIVSDGKICGVVRTAEKQEETLAAAPPEKPRRGFFSRLWELFRR
jgi:uncharacterized protein YtpQ (UPF0354 family)